MGGGASTAAAPFASSKEAFDAGKSQAEIDHYFDLLDKAAKSKLEGLDMFTLQGISSCLNVDGTWSNTLSPAAQRIGDACITLFDCSPCQWRGDSGPGKNDASEGEGNWGGFLQSILPRMLNMTAPSSAEAESALLKLKIEHPNFEDVASILNEMLEMSATDEDNTPPGWPALAAWLYAVLGRALLSLSPSDGVNTDSTGLDKGGTKAVTTEAGTAEAVTTDGGKAKIEAITTTETGTAASAAKETESKGKNIKRTETGTAASDAKETERKGKKKKTKKKGGQKGRSPTKHDLDSEDEGDNNPELTAKLKAMRTSAEEANELSLPRFVFESDLIRSSSDVLDVKNMVGVWTIAVAFDGSAILAHKKTPGEKKEQRWFGQLEAGMKFFVPVAWSRTKHGIKIEENPLCSTTADTVKAHDIETKRAGIKALPDSVDLLRIEYGGITLGDKNGVTLKPANDVDYIAMKTFTANLFACNHVH